MVNFEPPAKTLDFSRVFVEEKKRRRFQKISNGKAGNHPNLFRQERMESAFWGGENFEKRRHGDRQTKPIQENGLRVAEGVVRMGAE